jgi:hypothetical protein
MFGFLSARHEGAPDQVTRKELYNGQRCTCRRVMKVQISGTTTAPDRMENSSHLAPCRYQGGHIATYRSIRQM